MRSLQHLDRRLVSILLIAFVQMVGAAMILPRLALLHLSPQPALSPDPIPWQESI